MVVQRKCSNNEKHAGNSISWDQCNSGKPPSSASKTAAEQIGTSFSSRDHRDDNGGRTYFLEVGDYNATSLVPLLESK